MRLQFNLIIRGRAQPVPVEAVTGNYFDMMKLTPVAGRALRGDDGDAVMLGEGLWRTGFQG